MSESGPSPSAPTTPLTPSRHPAVAPAASAPPQAAGWHGFPGSARSRGLAVGGFILLGMVFLFGGDSWMSVIDTAMIAAIATLGLNVLSGYAGQISLGIAFFMGVGAYTAAWLGGPAPQLPGDPAGLNLSFLIWLPAAGIVAALAGAVIGPTALRLKGFYLGIVTLALVFIGQYLFVNLRGITGGPQGRIVPQPGFGDFSFGSPDPVLGIQFTASQWYFLLLLVMLGMSAVFVANVARSRAGRAWQAVRDNDTAASIMGVNLFSAKQGAFVLSSFLAGIAGALWASYPGYTNPPQWNLILSIEFIAAMLIGGVASVWGSILGAAFVFALPTALENFALLPQSASSVGLSGGDLSTILYGLLIIVFLLFEPLGIVGLIRRLQNQARRHDERLEGGEASGNVTTTASLVSSQPESQLDVERNNL
jgi:branched-chain amino acid transport system permease protein